MNNPAISPDRISRRVATIDWMRGVVMVLMVIDHAAMAFNARVTALTTWWLFGVSSNFTAAT